MRRSYLSVVGDSWAAAQAWRRTFPDEPFLGVRFDGRTAWVLFEPKTTGGPLRPMLTRAIQQAFEEAGGGWIDENVFIYEAPSPGAGHRLARRPYAPIQCLSRGRDLARNLLAPLVRDRTLTGLTRAS
jgi:hypothetical protein